MDQAATDALREHFRAQEDRQLVVEALTASTDLTPVACEILKAELGSRNLVPALWPTFETRGDRMSPRELDALAERVQSMPCPHCGERATNINAYATSRPTPLWLIGWKYAPEFTLGCHDCLCVRFVFTSKPKPGKRWKPTELLRGFVYRHAGLLSHFGSNEAAMAALIRFDLGEFLRIIHGGAPAGSSPTVPAGPAAV